MLNYTKEQFIEEYKNETERSFLKSLQDTTPQERYYSLVTMLKKHLEEVKADTELAVNRT